MDCCCSRIPLHPPRKPEQQATNPRIFRSSKRLRFFLHGSRDPFGSIEEMQAAIA